MRYFVFSFLAAFQVFNLAGQGITKYGQITITSTNFVDLNGRIASNTALDKRGYIYPPVFSCGNALAVTHTLGDGIAPVTKTVNYGTVTTTLSGASKCWITQNLGADNQATSATDATETAAGWYWQFNRKQGYKHDGTTLTPAWTITSIDETSDWLPANDPCTLELGTGWRIPTSTEWTNADATGAWANHNNTYASVLKLHAAGSLNNNNGSLSACGAYGYYWGNTQANATTGRYLYFDNIYSFLDGNYKTYGFSVRCLKDDSSPVFSCGNAMAVTHTLGDGIAPVTKTVNYGTVTTTLSGANKCWITQNLGSDHQAGSETDNTEASAGWYWQFNLKQGFKHDGATRTPATAWNASISETSDWLPANDPCTLSLGTGWRIPTSTEWTNADATGGWVSYNNDATGTFGSVLKLHAAGCLDGGDGSLGIRGTNGRFWSSTQSGAGGGWYLDFNSIDSYVNDDGKAYGFPLRCLGDYTTNTAGTASSTPTLEINTALTAITHSTTGATAISNSGVSGANGLPTGVSAAWASNTITISGTPTALGIFNYSILLTGGFGSINATGTITVIPTIPTVTSTTGKIWMDRNLGATRVATSSNDAASYGDLYQWGRGADGHQIRTSATTSTLSVTDVPGNANYILSPVPPYDWRNPQNTNLWQGVNGTNNPCPSGFRIPTDIELDAERLSWASNNAGGAFASPLKLPAAGLRRYNDGTLGSVGSIGYYWASTIDGTYSRGLYFRSNYANMNSNNRAYGYSVRCIKD